MNPASVPKGRLFATTRDELIECAALVHSIRSGVLDALAIPPWPLDVMAQQIVAMAACEPWVENELFNLIRRAYPYRDLPRRDFDAVVAMLSDGIATNRGRSGAFLHRDQINGMVRARRGARLAAITSGGAIPEAANYFVVAEPEETIVGTVDEDFAVESLAGDVFLLGTTSWRIRRVEAGRCGEDAGQRLRFPGAARLPAARSNCQKKWRIFGIRSKQNEPVDETCRNAGSIALSRAGVFTFVQAPQRFGAVPNQHTVIAERFLMKAAACG